MKTVRITVRLDSRLKTELSKRVRREAGGNLGVLLRRLLAECVGRPELGAVNPEDRFCLLARCAILSQEDSACSTSAPLRSASLTSGPTR